MTKTVDRPTSTDRGGSMENLRYVRQGNHKKQENCTLEKDEVARNATYYGMGSSEKNVSNGKYKAMNFYASSIYGTMCIEI